MSPRPRRVAGSESAYERRIRLYLEKHPGASRQLARGHRPQEYQARVLSARRRTPGISTSAAAGHSRSGEREAFRAAAAIRRLPQDGQVAFTGVDRQPDGTWLTARFDLLNGGEQTFLVGPDGHYLLPYIADVIASTGVLMLGAKYLQQMAEQQEHQAFVLVGRKGRFVSGVNKRGYARTVVNSVEAIVFPEARVARRYLSRWKLAKRGYRVVEL